MPTGMIATRVRGTGFLCPHSHWRMNMKRIPGKINPRSYGRNPNFFIVGISKKLGTMKNRR
jgi:hypothetical protein